MNPVEALNVILATAPSEKLKKSVIVGAYTVATDGHRLLAVSGTHTCDLPHDQFPLKSVSEWMEETPRGSRLPFATLAEFIGKYIDPKPCDKCQGDGTIWRSCEHCDEHDHPCPCANCDDGKILHVEGVRVGRAVVNANLIADVLPLLESENVLIYSTDAESKVRIYGDGWIFFMMPMRNTEAKRTLELA